MLESIRSLFRRSTAEVLPPPAAPAAAAASLVMTSSTSTSITARPKNSFFKDVFGNAFPIYDGGSNRATTKEAFIAAFQPASIKDDKDHPARLAINNRNYIIGEFSTPTLKECRDALIGITSSDDFKKIPADKIKLKEGESVADGKDLIPSGSAKNDAYLMHVTETEAGLFQAASQFNALEFKSQHQKPENGISCYIDDETQGPACALACATAIAYRNDLVKVKDGLVDDQGQVGQTADNQINFLVTAQTLLREKAGIVITDTLDKETANQIDITDGNFFVVKNGYVESTANNLRALNLLLEDPNKQSFRNELKNAIRAGIHRNTEVTADPNSSDANPRLVNQIYVSALSIGYSNVKDKTLWEPMAKICLESAYEHTLIEGLRNNAKRILAGQPPQKIMLTKVGGGVFENQPQWIEEAMTKAIKEAGSYGIPFEVELVHFNKDDANRYYGPAEEDRMGYKGKLYATKGSLEKAIEEANKIALAKIEERRAAEEAVAAAAVAAAATAAAATAAAATAAAATAAALAAPPPPAAGAPHPAALAPAPAAAASPPVAPPPASPRADPLAAAGAGADSPPAPEGLHVGVPAVLDVAAEVRVGGDPAGGAGVVPAVVSPAVAQAPFVFPQALKRFSPIQTLLDSTKIADDQPLKPIVVILSGDPKQSGVTTLEKSLEVIKKHVDSRGEIKEQKIIFIRNTGDHWNVHERSTMKSDFSIDHQIDGNGYCGLTSAIVASELIESRALPAEGSPARIFRNEGGSFNILTDSKNAVSDSNKQILLTECFGDVTSLEEGSPKKLAHDAVIRLIDNRGRRSIKSTDAKGKKIPEEFWLRDNEIIEVIKHRSPDQFVYLDVDSEKPTNCHDSLSRTPHFERKVAFLKYLDSPITKISDINGLEGLTLSQLLFDSNDKSKYDPDRVKLCIKVLDKFIGENPSSDTPEKKQKILDFYKLMEDVSSNAEDWTTSFDNDFLAVKVKFDSLGINDDEYKRLDKKITKNLATRPISEIDVAKKNFFKELKSKKSEEDLIEFQDLLKETFKKDGGISFKDKINLLMEKAFLQEFNIEFNIDSIDIFDNDYSKTYNKENLKPSFAFLARCDPDFIPAIIPEILQLKPKIAFKGWGKKIEFKDGKILIDDQEVKEIKNDRGVDVIKELRKDFLQDSPQQDHPLFKHAVIDFFRNADGVTLVYSDQKESKLEQGQKETLICKDTSKLFEKVVGNPEVGESDTQDLMLDRVEAHSKKTVVGVGGSKPRAEITPPKASITKEAQLREIKKHLDERFKLLDKMLKGDKKAMVVIPGFINDQGNEVYSLGTGLAVDQWGKDDESKKLLKECQDHIKAKIDALKTNYSDQILLGNVGNQISEKTDSNGVSEKYYLPQFPIWDGDINYVRDTTKDLTKLKEAEDRLIKSYESMCAKLNIDATIVPAKVDNNQDVIIREYQKLLFSNDPQDLAHKPHFDGIKFIHLWGANCENFNNDIDNPIDGGGQADAFKNAIGQIFGIFGLITTIYKYNQNKIHVIDKIHDNSSSPSPSPAPGAATAVSRASSSASPPA